MDKESARVVFYCGTLTETLVLNFLVLDLAQKKKKKKNHLSILIGGSSANDNYM